MSAFHGLDPVQRPALRTHQHLPEYGHSRGLRTHPGYLPATHVHPAADFDTCTNLADDMGLRPWAAQRSPGPSPPRQLLNGPSNAGGSGPREDPVVLSISSPPRSTPTTISHDFITKLMAGGPGKVVD